MTGGTGGGWTTPPPFDPDPELIDHLEGNKRERQRYRDETRRMRDGENPPPGPFRELVEAMAAPGHPDRLGVILGGAIAGFMGALLHARGITLWLVPLVVAWMLAMVVVAVHLLRTILRQRDAAG